MLINAKVLHQRKSIQSRLLTENNLRRFLEAVRAWESLSAEVKIETFSPGPVLLVNEQKDESGRLTRRCLEHQEVF